MISKTERPSWIRKRKEDDPRCWAKGCRKEHQVGIATYPGGTFWVCDDHYEQLPEYDPEEGKPPRDMPECEIPMEEGGAWHA